MRRLTFVASLRSLARRVLRPRAADRGSVLVTVAAGMAMLVGMSALTLDAGRYMEVRRQLQNAVDAAALAAAQELPDTGAASQVAEQYWQYNAVPLQGIGVDVSFPTGEYPQVRVEARGDVNLVFARVLGFELVDVGAGATVELQQEPSPYSLITLNETECGSLTVNGGAAVQVTGGGGTYTRSNCYPDALAVEGSASLEAGLHDVVGGADGSGISPAANEGARYRRDTYEDLAPPPIPSDCWGGPYQFSGGTHVLSPGVRYCDEIKVTSDTVLTFEPGIYVLEDGLSVSGQASLVGTGEVLLYNTCPGGACNGDRPSNVSFSGGGTLDLTGHSDYGHIVLWVDRTAGTPSKPPLVELSGGVGQGLEGAIYVPSGHVDIAGSAGVAVELSVTVVADTAQIRGNGTFNLVYDVDRAPPRNVMRLVD